MSGGNLSYYHKKANSLIDLALISVNYVDVLMSVFMQFCALSMNNYAQYIKTRIMWINDGA